VITEEILIDFVNGKQTAFDAIYKAYAPGMYGICLRYSRCSDDAQDILQEAFIKIYKNKKSYDTTKPIGAWIKTITIHEAINYIKRSYKMVLTDKDIAIEDLSSEDDQSEEHELLKKKLLSILNQLPDGYRTVFNLYTIDNLTHIEIAEFLNISVGTSKSQYFKAKKMIQQLLNQAGEKTDAYITNNNVK
jgi:RNA polymerase sigma-70 factor, ECF subfamily